MRGCPMIGPKPWHVNPVDPDDDRMLYEVMERRYKLTGEYPTKSGTLKRAVRRLWVEEVNDGDVA